MSELRDKIAAACRVLFVEGHADMNLGHVSAREPGSNSLWLKPGRIGLEETTADNLVELDLEGDKLSGTLNPPGEWPLHTEIFKARANVNCVIHTHPLWTVIFGIVGQAFQVVNQDGVFVRDGLRYYSGTAELITTKAQGKSLAHDLGDGSILIMPNHGVTLVGASVQEALPLALNLEKAMQAQMLAAMLGGPRQVVDPALASLMGRRLLSGANRAPEVIYSYLVRKADRALAAPRSGD